MREGVRWREGGGVEVRKEGGVGVRESIGERGGWCRSMRRGWV